MISRDAAKELMVAKPFGTTQADMAVIDKIYDSLGSCESCEFGGVPEHGDCYYPLVTCVASEEYAVESMPLDGFCSKFKEVTDGN